MIKDGGAIPGSFPGGHNATDKYCVGCQLEQTTITLCYMNNCNSKGEGYVICYGRGSETIIKKCGVLTSEGLLDINDVAS